MAGRPGGNYRPGGAGGNYRPGGSRPGGGRPGGGRPGGRRPSGGGSSTPKEETVDTKEQGIEVQGVIAENLPNAMFVLNWKAVTKFWPMCPAKFG